MTSAPRATGSSTTAGTLLFVFAFAVALGFVLWVVGGPLDWLSGWRINRASGLVVLAVGIPVAFVVFLLVAFLVWAALSTVLEAAGVKLSLPAQPAAAIAGTPPPALAPGTDTHGLAPEEATRARDVGIYGLHAHGTDEHGWPESYLRTVAWCLNDEELGRSRAARPLQPGWDELKSGPPRSLLSLVAGGEVNAGQAREFLRRIDAGEPWRRLAPPLTDEERAAAAMIKVWYVWYEDNFGTGGQRDSFAVAVCLTREEADAASASRGKPLQAGGDGYKVVGPYGLELEAQPDVVREVLALAASGRGGTVNIG